MEYESAKDRIISSLAALGVIITTGVLGLCAVDAVYDHTKGPCPISSLTHNSKHQVKKLEQEGWNVSVEKEPNTYIINPTIQLTATGEKVYFAPEGGILKGSKVVMPNPTAGYTVLQISKYEVKSNQGYTLRKTIKMGY